MIFKRKAYNKLIEWKNKSRGRTAILIEGDKISLTKTTPLEAPSRK